jgi:hypothetical protein
MIEKLTDAELEALYGKEWDTYTLRLACYVCSAKDLETKLKAEKKKAQRSGDNSRLTVVEGVARARGL